MRSKVCCANHASEIVPEIRDSYVLSSLQGRGSGSSNVVSNYIM